ncbi:hypothetical protein INT46_010484 [Mucor plumbeus]|uniref:Uncharacterized protein n=1 Tax=Mucor plumbeus TaxID=97098 RepID=A0A8H7RLV2_9FUNG|nr:hypothetical protein INT46_010484 [Mucor plumbeus]
MIHSYVHNLDWDISDKLYLLGPRPYNASSFEDIVFPDTSSAQQMWGPFEHYGLDELPLKLSKEKFLLALNHFHIRALNEDISRDKLLECCIANSNKIIISGRACQESDEDKDIVWKSQLYAKNINEYRRGNTFIMFYATNSNGREGIFKKWYIGSLMFFFEHTIENAHRILTLVEVAEEHGVCDYDPTIPLNRGHTL